MTRKEAVEDLKTLKDFFIEQSGGSYPMSLEYAINELEKNLITEWIPVSERLPEYGIEVLTINKDDEYEINHIIDDEDGEWFWDGAIAWMPMPDPYEEEETE